RIIICDPVRNRLLSEGPKTDKIDARKLCLLLRSGLLKEVYHTLEQDYHLRKLVSAYEDVVKMGVRLLNQRAAMNRAHGYTDDTVMDPQAKFIDEHLAGGLTWYEETKASYEALFRHLARTDRRIRHQTDRDRVKTRQCSLTTIMF
ncbi:MAG: transposase, partial [Nitrososphaera sp.]|nr:transposase [Nitrososphaera sp.]